jgi:hypothetical protein
MIIHNPILTGSFTVNGTDVASITSSAASITAINNYTASQNILNGTYATTGSNTFADIQTVNSNLIVTGSITASTLVVQTITSSVDFVTGSTRFGSIAANTHQFTGSVGISGSLTGIGATFNGNVAVGATLSDWISSAKVLQLNNTAAVYAPTDESILSNNVFVDSGDNNKYITTNFASQYRQVSGQHLFYSAASGTAGATISFGSPKLTIASSGAATFISTLSVNGAATLGTGASSYTFGGGSSAAGGLTDKDLTLKAWSPTSGTNEYAGDLILQSGVGTGNGSGKLGSVIIKAGIDGASSSTLGTYSTIATFTKSGVGIGTSSPSAILHTSVTTNGTSIGALFANPNQAGTADAVSINFGLGRTTDAFLFSIPAIKFGKEQQWTSTGSTVDGYLAFSTMLNETVTERMRITSGGIIYALNSGVDGTYQPMIGGMYTANNNETNLISTAVSSNATQSGFRFDVSNGAGSSARTTSMTINRSSVTIVGSLSKGSGTFKIGHPLESKKDTNYLVHSFVEGPRADLIYRGKVTLVNGTATINIDETVGMTEGTFVALNRDIQCFTTNESGWDLVKGKVEGNILTITSQNTESTNEISWMVVGERQDEHIKNTDWTDENGKPILEPSK